MLITIDGRNGQGKSTIGEMLGEKLGISFFSTGLLIRFLAQQYQQLSINGISNDKIFEILYQNISIETIISLQKSKNIDLYNSSLTDFFSLITNNKKMLKIVDEVLKDYTKVEDVILDGRNLYEIFPKADFKFYFESSLGRRIEIGQLSNHVTREESLKKIQSRDSQERNFNIPYSDLIVIDPLSFSLDDLLNYIYEMVVKGK